MAEKTFRRTVERVLAAASLPGDFRLRSLPGGANNRVFRLDVAGRTLLLKSYFQHPDDNRDRLGAEFLFSRFVWNSGCRALPEPIFRDPKNGIGIYEFISGRKLKKSEITASRVEEALEFIRAVNVRNNSAEARKLPAASEAFFSVAAHLERLNRRVEMLSGISGSSEVDREAKAFLRGQISKEHKKVFRAAEAECAKIGLPLEKEIAPRDRCVSPSDFGFHNAILAADGKLRFIDFEYAGWDDPAKLACDFFCQPAKPVSMKHFDSFAEAVASATSDPETNRRRIALLLPVYRLKWVCVLMNEFLPSGGARRRFAHASAEKDERKKLQLGKARRALDDLYS